MLCCFFYAFLVRMSFSIIYLIPIKELKKPTFIAGSREFFNMFFSDKWAMEKTKQSKTKQKQRPILLDQLEQFDDCVQFDYFDYPTNPKIVIKIVCSMGYRSACQPNFDMKDESCASLIMKQQRTKNLPVYVNLEFLIA